MYQRNLLTADEAAAYLGLAKATLAKWRCSGGIGPKFVKLGLRRVAYEMSALEEFVAAHNHRHTSEYSAG